MILLTDGGVMTNPDGIIKDLSLPRLPVPPGGELTVVRLACSVLEVVFIYLFLPPGLTFFSLSVCFLLFSLFLLYLFWHTAQEPFRWEQRIHSMVLKIPGIPAFQPVEEPSSAEPTGLQRLCDLTGGRCQVGDMSYGVGNCE
jgi:hypothetical protein